jgi:hypothetical protein
MTNHPIAPIGFKRVAALAVTAALAGVVVDVIAERFVPKNLVDALSSTTMLSVVLVGFHGGRDVSLRKAVLIALCIALLTVGFRLLLSI